METDHSTELADSRPSKAFGLPILFCILALPYLFESDALKTVTFVVQIAVLTFYAAIYHIRFPAAGRLKRRIPASMAGIFIFSALVSYINGSIKIHELAYYILVPILIMTITQGLVLADKGDESAVLDKVFLSISIYVAICVTLHLLGFTPSKDIEMYEAQSRMGQVFGFKERVNFPFTPGINSFAVIIGLSIIGLINRIIYNFSTRSLLITLGLLPFSLFAIIGVDSRGPLAYILIAYLITSFIRYSFKLFCAVALSFLATIAYFLAHMLDYVSLLAPILSKLSGRPIIWAFAIGNLLHFQIRHLIGYGLYGQTASGVCYQYGWLFSGYKSSTVERISLHDVYIQYIYDFGYLGLALCLVFLSLTIYRLSKGRGDRYKATMVALIYLLLCGFTEPVPSIYLLPPFFILFYALNLQGTLET